MRMSRRLWLSNFFKMNLTGERKPQSKREPRPAKKALIDWLVVVGKKEMLVKAHTKSEARALAKRQLNIKGRLPALTLVRRVA